jgi:hypothetical protein
MYGSPKPELISERCDIGDQLIRMPAQVHGQWTRRRDRQAEGKKGVVVDIVVHQGWRHSALLPLAHENQRTLILKSKVGKGGRDGLTHFKRQAQLFIRQASHQSDEPFPFPGIFSDKGPLHDETSFNLNDK